jgi:hypothetical protein
MENEEIIIKLMEEKFDLMGKKFDGINEKFDIQNNEIKELKKEMHESNIELRKEMYKINEKLIREMYLNNEKLTEKLNTFETNHLKHIELEIENLKGSLDVVKPISYMIAGGVLLSVVKYLFFP